MKNLKNKLMLAVAAGVLMMGNAAYAAETQQDDALQAIDEAFSVEYNGGCIPPECRPNHSFDNLALAEKMARNFGVKRSEVMDAIYAGVSHEELRNACLLAKASGKSLESIMIAHHNMDWPQLYESLEVSPEDIGNIMLEFMAERVAEKAHSDKATVLKLLKKNYQPKDIELAGILAAESGRTIENVLSKRNINNTWHDVAEELKIDRKALEKNHFDHGHGHGKPDCPKGAFR